jgi:hypothetical protein
LKILSIPFALIAVCACAHAKLSPLAPAPDWSRLDAFQETITRGDFQALLDRVYAPGGAWTETISIGDAGATIRTSDGRSPYFLKFAPDAASSRRPSTYWRPRAALGAVDPAKPLAGLKVALDPGHIGGSFAKMEERWFQIGNSAPVTEGDMTLRVAKLLVPRLQALGAEVFLTRSKPAPVTPARPQQLRNAAAASLRQKGEAVTPAAVAKESERLFYRASEIRRRARIVNEAMHPDVVVCLHFNAEEWGDEKHPRLTSENHLHFLITGAMTRDELSHDDQRLDMLVKLLSRSFSEELPLTEALAETMSRATGLPPYAYSGGSVVRVGGSPYVWARNLLANRLFSCPVVYAEPYVMNSRNVFARIQAGDYNGLREFGGIPRKSIFREYADAIAAGLAKYYSTR